MSTCQEVLDVARIDLNDAKTSGSDADCRNLDADLLKSLNAFVGIAWGARPDMFFDLYSLGEQTLVLNDPFPLPSRYEAACAHYIVARAEIKDDEHVTQGRVALLNAEAKNLLTQV